MPILTRISQYRQKQPRRRKNGIEGTCAYAGVPESEQGWYVCALVIRSEDQPEFVTCMEASSVGHKWNPTSQLFCNRQRLESPAR